MSGHVVCEGVILPCTAFRVVGENLDSLRPRSPISLNITRPTRACPPPYLVAVLSLHGSITKEPMPESRDEGDQTSCYLYCTAGAGLPAVDCLQWSACSGLPAVWLVVSMFCLSCANHAQVLDIFWKACWVHTSKTKCRYVPWACC